jgi:hypothetical protein
MKELLRMRLEAEEKAKREEEERIQREAEEQRLKEEQVIVD